MFRVLTKISVGQLASIAWLEGDLECWQWLRFGSAWLNTGAFSRQYRTVYVASAAGLKHYRL